jgi:hypothetical protein
LHATTPPPPPPTHSLELEVAKAVELEVKYPLLPTEIGERYSQTISILFLA